MRCSKIYGLQNNRRCDVAKEKEEEEDGDVSFIFVLFDGRFLHYIYMLLDVKIPTLYVHTCTRAMCHSQAGGQAPLPPNPTGLVSVPTFAL